MQCYSTFELITSGRINTNQILLSCCRLVTFCRVILGFRLSLIKVLLCFILAFVQLSKLDRFDIEHCHTVIELLGQAEKDKA